jgi:hypothetical protein
VAKTILRIMDATAIVVATMCFEISPGWAFGDAPWCAVINLPMDVYWDCQYRSVEECVSSVTGGNRGFCSLNPWPSPNSHMAVASTHLRRHAQQN